MALTKPTVVESIRPQLNFTRIQSIDCVETLLKNMKKPWNLARIFWYPDLVNSVSIQKGSAEPETRPPVGVSC